MSKRSALVLAGVAAAAVPLVGAVPSAAMSHPADVHHSGTKTRVIAACVKAQYKPTKYIYYCGDGSAGMTHATYKSWKTTSATGSGTYVYDDCNPNCASGKTHREKGTKFKLYHVVNTKKYGPLFTKDRLTYPNGHHQTYTLPRKPA